MNFGDLTNAAMLQTTIAVATPLLLAALGEMLIERHKRSHEPFRRRFIERTQAVRGRFIGTEHTKARRAAILFHDVAQKRAEHAR